jgi:hypothetical protein
VPRARVIEAPTPLDRSTAYRTRLRQGAELYVPAWFGPREGGYDLIVHFHGLGTLQERNLERIHINAAVVSINLGASTDVYANAFREPRAFERLLDETQTELEKSDRARGARIRRIALSAWSAGFASIAKIVSDTTTDPRVDAILIADGFFTSFRNIQRRTINTASLSKFVTLAEVAARDQKLFVITHTTIPTVDYASTQETATALLQLTSSTKAHSNAEGPADMRETYAVDRGAFHVRGFEGVTAKDHIRQITAMGETMYPYLFARWNSVTP